jgi:hypothetical protein
MGTIIELANLSNRVAKLFNFCCNAPSVELKKLIYGKSRSVEYHAELARE